MPEELKVAMVGAGGISEVHAESWKQSGRAQIVAVVDPNLSAARAKGTAWGCPAYSSIAEMTRHHSPDLADVCTPEHVHHSSALQALDAGLPVFLEKIMASNLADGRELREAGRTRGLWTGLNYNYHFFPAFQYLKEVVTSGREGALVQLNLSCHSFCFHHVLEATLWLQGRPTQVWARGAERDWPEGFEQKFQIAPELLYIPGKNFTGVLDYADGRVATLTASLRPGLGVLPFHVLATFASGRVFEATDLNWEADMVGRLTWLPEKESVPSGLAPHEVRGNGLSFHRSLARVAQAVLGGQPPESSWEDGWTVMAVDHALLTAGRTGSVQRVES